MNQVVIAVGGRGERARPLSDLIPKPLFTIAGNTFLAHLISSLAKHGARDFLLLTGYLHDQFVQEARDLENRLNISIQIHFSPVENPTGARLLKAQNQLNNNFVFLYGDVFLPLTDSQIISLLSTTNFSFYAYQGVFRRDKANVKVSGNRLIEYQKNYFLGANAINCGYFVLNQNCLRLIDEDSSVEDSLLSKEEFTDYVYVNLGRNKYYTVGDPLRRAMAEIYFSSRKTVLFDRDGTLLNGLEPAQFYSDFTEKYLKNGTLDLLKKLFDANYQIGVITNQPAVGNGHLSYQEMLNVNRKFLEVLGRNGIKVKAFSICSHGWNDNCDCRKPRPGLMYEVQHLLDLNWSSTLYVGDMERDEDLAREVGCGFIKVSSTETEINSRIFDNIECLLNEKSG